MDSSFAIPSPGLTSQGHAASLADHNRARQNGLPNAKDMSHHLNFLAKNRTPSSLKELYKWMTVPGMVVLGGGVPSPELFPYETLSASILPVDQMPLDPPRKPIKPKKTIFDWLWPASTADRQSFTIPKYVPNADANTIQLATSLQYQAATGPPALALWLRDYVQKVYQPAYADWDVLINCGATDAWGKIVFMLMNRGDAVLVEEWTYPGAENSFLPLDVEMVAIKMDGQGVIPQHMEQVLGEWDEAKRGRPRPRVFYTIPTGQNPTGATMMGERKKQIYDICSKYDVIICEDEPYYCLYTGKWTPRGHKNDKTILATREREAEKQEGKKGAEAFLRALPPTYLKYDTDGRVIRMDTFSKTSCPGSRLGWFTASPIFIERLTRATEASTQAPSGFVTAMTTTLLNTWGKDGYIRWLRGIKATYNMRKTWMCDLFEEVFHMEFEVAESSFTRRNVRVVDVGNLGRGVTLYLKEDSNKWDEKRGVQSARGHPVISFIPPTAGMFVFLAVHVSHHPDYQRLVHKGEDAVRVLMDKLWLLLAENLVLFAPGWGFDAHGEHAIGGEGIGYYRLSYSIATYEEMRDAIIRVEKVMRKFFEV